MRHLESDLQIACKRWFGRTYPALNALLFAIPNGGKRNIREAERLRQEGVEAGIPDMMLAVPTSKHHGMFIEMKAGRNKPTRNQNEKLKLLEEKGYKTHVVRTKEEFILAIENYLQVETTIFKHL